MKALMIALLVLVALCPLRPVLAQGYTQELMHTYVFGTEGTGADLICKRTLVILYQDNLSSSGASIANVMMLMGLDRKGGNTRTLVTFRLNDEWGGTWKQVPVSKFFLFAGEAGAIAANEIVPPIISKPCTEQPQDICHMMRSADDVMLESYIGGESQLERSKDFVGLKKHFPYLQMATTGEWGLVSAEATISQVSG